MFNTLKNWLSGGKNTEEVSGETQRVLENARRSAEKDLGRQLPHELQFRTREAIGGVLGRCHPSARSLVELSTELKKNPVELFITYYHELMHAAGIMKEGAAEWLAQKAAKLNGYSSQTVAYPQQTRAFEELAAAMSPISDLRTRFTHMLRVAQENEFGLHGKAVQAFRRKGLGSPAAQSKAKELIGALE